MAQGETKNIGQVAAIWINSVAPTNTKLVWYDTSNNVHRVYNTSTGQWDVLNPQIITNTTLQNLAATATLSGLPKGKFYYLVDVGCLAISITTTKIWYVDTHNNYVINDLAGAIQHYLNANNLVIDGKTGVWDSATGKLAFSFSEILYPGQLDRETDAVLLHRGTGSFFKVKLKNLISTVSGNSITWNGGLFFSASSFISSIRNVVGGVVGYDQYQIDIYGINTALANLAADNNQVRDDCKDYTDEKVTDTQIFNKKLQSAITVSGSPANTPSVGWSFNQILSDIYGWFSRLRWGNYIRISINFNANGQSGEINQSDTVATAFQKTVYQLKKLAISDNVKLPSDFDSEDSVTYTGYPVANNSLTQAVGKLTLKVRELFARPYINESTWHQGTNVSWIIRNNTLFVNFSRIAQGSGVTVTLERLINANRAYKLNGISLGIDATNIIEKFASIPYSYTWQADGGYNHQQKFVSLMFYKDLIQWAYTKHWVTSGNDNLFMNIEGEIGLCIEEVYDVWGDLDRTEVYIGYNNHTDLTAEVDSDPMYKNFSIENIFPQTVAVPLSF